MAPNSPACSFIHASMAGSRSTTPLNRSNSVLIVAPRSCYGSSYLSKIRLRLHLNVDSQFLFNILGDGFPPHEEAEPRIENVEPLDQPVPSIYFCATVN